MRRRVPIIWRLQPVRALNTTTRCGLRRQDLCLRADTAREATAPGEAALVVELRQLDDMAPLVEAWRDLQRRSLESNIFLDPDFAVPAFTYLRPRNFRFLSSSSPGRTRACWR